MLFPGGSQVQASNGGLFALDSTSRTILDREDMIDTVHRYNAGQKNTQDGEQMF